MLCGNLHKSEVLHYKMLWGGPDVPGFSKTGAAVYIGCALTFVTVVTVLFLLGMTPCQRSDTVFLSNKNAKR